MSELVSSMTEYWLSASSKGVIVPSGFSPIGLSNSSLEEERKERENSIHQHHTHIPPPAHIHILLKRKVFKKKTKVFFLKFSLCVCNRKDERGMERKRGR